MKSTFERDMEAKVSQNPQYETGLWENLQVGFNATQREDLPIWSRWAADTDADQRGKKILLDAYESGKIPESVMDNFTFMGKTDVEGALNYLDKAGISNEFQVEDYVKQRNEEYELNRANDRDVFDRAGMAGAVGQFTGSMGATFTDPMYLATLPLGIGTANTILSAGMRTAALSVGIEAVAVPFIWDFKKDVGADYGAKDAMVHLGTAATGGFLIGGGAKALGKVFTAPYMKLHQQAESYVKDLTPGDIKGMASSSIKHQSAPTTVDKAADIPSFKVEESPAYKRGEEVLGDKAKLKMEDDLVEPKAGDGSEVPGAKDLDDLEIRQKQSRLEELEKKQKQGELPDRELDELEMLNDELSATSTGTPESIVTQVNESLPGHGIKFDGEFDRTALKKGPLYQFTPQEGEFKGRTISVEELSPEALVKRMEELGAKVEPIKATPKEIQDNIDALTVSEKTKLRAELRKVTSPNEAQDQTLKALEKELAYRDKADVKIKGESAPTTPFMDMPSVKDLELNTALKKELVEALSKENC